MCLCKPENIGRQSPTAVAAAFFLFESQKRGTPETTSEENVANTASSQKDIHFQAAPLGQAIAIYRLSWGSLLPLLCSDVRFPSESLQTPRDSKAPHNPGSKMGRPASIDASKAGSTCELGRLQTYINFSESVRDVGVSQKPIKRLGKYLVWDDEDPCRVLKFSMSNIR